MAVESRNVGDIAMPKNLVPSGRRRWLFAASIAVFTVIAVLGGQAIYKSVRWKRFSVVSEGKVYRSGQLSERHFEAAIDQLGLKTVLCLNDEQAARERDVCRQKGVQFFHFNMPSDGKGRPEDFVRVVQILRDAEKQPVLVHCSAGVARTGVSVALYRVAEEGWSLNDAIDELRSFERHGRIEDDLRQHIVDLYQVHFRETHTAKNASSEERR
ncbi:MAG: dual specificity protein phosphatase family protein [Planctomycetota bacterium]